MAFRKKKQTEVKPELREAVFEGDTPKDLPGMNKKLDARDEALLEEPEAEASDKKGQKRQRKAKAEKDHIQFDTRPYLKDIKPREKYVFHSDYYQVDNRFCTIMSFFHRDGALDNFGAFWGVNLIPTGLSSDVQIVILEQNRRMPESWIADRQHASEDVADANAREQSKSGSNAGKAGASQKKQDLEVIAQELRNGAAYLHVHWRILVTAPSLEELDAAVRKIERLYVDRYATLSAAPYFGEQRRELSRLFAHNDKKEGKGYYFTSKEYAGAYSLVTHGLEDPDGEYIGYMLGDVNNAAVLFNMDGYRQRVVVADESYGQLEERPHVSALWGSKLSQACLLNNGRCVHLIFDNTTLEKLGPKLERITYKLDLNRGDVNMFEMFGKRENQLSIFPSQMQKLVLMAEQAYQTTPADRSIIRGSLEEVATKFYIQQRMWKENAKEHQSELRVVGIGHKEVPRLQTFCSYLDTEYQALVNASARDDEKLHAISVLRITFRNLLSNNGDLFNTWTNEVIDGAVTGRRVLYDFSRLMARGTGIAMAQLVNVIGFAVSSLGVGDTVFIHGAEKIDQGVKEYINSQFDRLFDAGGRVVYLYNSIDKMLEDRDFCMFDRADYTIFGNLTDNQLDTYQKAVGQEIPADLTRLVTNKTDGFGYIRRGFDNIVFHRDLILGLPEAVEGRNRRW